MNAGPAFSRSADDVRNLKRAMQNAWNTPGPGYHEMATGFAPAIERLLDVTGVGEGLTVLDVATGTGAAAIAAAKRGATVTAIDFAADLLEHGRELARAEEVDVDFRTGDAEDLAFADASFDIVISSFGCMFAPRQDAVAYELARVLKPGGTLGMTTWKPEGPNCELMNITAPYLPPRVQEIPSPFNWGRPDLVTEMLSPYVASISFDEGDVPWIVESPTEALDMLFRRCLGPTVYTYQQFDHKTKLAVRADAMALMQRNLAGDGSVRLSRHYLLTVATRR